MPTYSSISFYSNTQARTTAVDLKIQAYLRGAEQILRSNDAGYAMRSFPLQEPAFRFADHLPAASCLRIFSVEKSCDGRRSFMAASYAQFWDHYQQLDPSDRHHYEIIREALPCHLYFDLEYALDCNPDACGVDLISQLLRCVTTALKNTEGKQAPFVDTGVYTRNRAMRLLLSSKAGKTATLENTGRFGGAGKTSHEMFLCTLAGKAVGVRSWAYWDTEGLLLLNMRGTRWCGNVQREHRSNGVFYVADLQAGIWYRMIATKFHELPLHVAGRCLSEEQNWVNLQQFA
ncbi:hypothetical protein WJX84_009713 [Apatococcus fuscideae]|uniref:DNA-directed primase/polymerase protein n=1 Tax=Apatococcus fuscideae TaxID=2026836 RepID=A0AAW1TD44_9CHLO